MDVHGAMVAQVTLLEDTAITALAWSCPKFKMDDSEETNSGRVSSTGDSSSSGTGGEARHWSEEEENEEEAQPAGGGEVLE